MATEENNSGQDKTEDPSDKRLDEARDEGQVAHSAEVTSLMSIVTGVLGFIMLGPTFLDGFIDSFKGALHFSSKQGLVVAVAWLGLYGLPLAKCLLMFFGIIFFSVIAASLLQTGIIVSWKSLEPKLSNVNPLSGFQKHFLTPQNFVQFIKSFLKVSVIGLIVYSAIHSHIEEFVASSALPAMVAFRWSMETIGSLVLKICIFLSIVAAADFGYQWYTLRQKLRMTKQEIKEEMKENQISEHVRAKVRQIQKERAKRQIRKEVPNADVIVTNPTHFAVALKYYRFKDKAPRVVAKGRDMLAATIRKLAQENNVPIYEYPELARKLYWKIRVGQTISMDLYESVARVLAYIYQLNRNRQTQGV